MVSNPKPERRSWIPFYGAVDRESFEIERQSMDRSGRILRFLDSVLPTGTLLDVGAGDGFTAERLAGRDRQVEFESLDDARKLLGLFYGDSGRECAKLEVGFSAIAYVRTSPA